MHAPAALADEQLADLREQSDTLAASTYRNQYTALLHSIEAARARICQQKATDARSQMCRTRGSSLAVFRPQCMANAVVVCAVPLFRCVFAIGQSYAAKLAAAHIGVMQLLR